MKEDAGIQRILNIAIRISPLVYVLIGAAGTCYSLKGDIDNVKADLDRHVNGFSHESWVSIDGLLHPALRTGVEKAIDERTEKRMQALKEEHRLWPCEVEADRRWDRLFDRNPTLAR